MKQAWQAQQQMLPWVLQQLLAWLHLELMH
jgi:hypothetical protein